MIETLINTPCTLIHRRASGQRDAHGRPTITETAFPTLCEVQQRQTSEPGDAGELGDAICDVFLAASVAVTTGDAIYVPGQGEFELIGRPEVVTDSLTGIAHHIEATARQTTGPGDGS